MDVDRRYPSTRGVHSYARTRGCAFPRSTLRLYPYHVESRTGVGRSIFGRSSSSFEAHSAGRLECCRRTICIRTHIGRAVTGPARMTADRRPSDGASWSLLDSGAPATTGADWVSSNMTVSCGAQRPNIPRGSRGLQHSPSRRCSSCERPPITGASRRMLGCLLGMPGPYTARCTSLGFALRIARQHVGRYVVLDVRPRVYSALGAQHRTASGGRGPRQATSCSARRARAWPGFSLLPAAQESVAYSFELGEDTLARSSRAGLSYQRPHPGGGSLKLNCSQCYSGWPVARMSG
ncbi:hypothetical protein OH77DRAFT_67587 [Trametes cingulata]|nr:hypothetical protein OH77DRAFT_67587 [Trametes cingulata]